MVTALFSDNVNLVNVKLTKIHTKIQCECKDIHRQSTGDKVCKGLHLQENSNFARFLFSDQDI